MAGESNDPTVIRVIAVHVADVVTALEATERGRETVLRVTSPFAGRVRARIHTVQAMEPADDGSGGPAPIRIPPRDLVAADTPSYPNVDETDPSATDSATEYDVEDHYERHAAAVAVWREDVQDHIVDVVFLDTATGPHRVTVSVLGENPVTVLATTTCEAPVEPSPNP